MSAFAFDDMIAVLVAQNMRNAETGTRTKDGDDAFFGKRQVRPAEMAKMLGFDVHHRMSDGAEIVDQSDPVDAEPVANLRGPDDPGIVGQLQYVAHDRAGDGNGCGARQGTSQQLAERFPSDLQARMRVRAKSGGIAEARDAAMVNVGDGEPRMRSSDIDGYEFH